MSATLRVIRERGFRRWYERELIRSHLHMVLLLLATVGALGALEALGDLRAQGLARSATGWQMAACLVLAAAAGAWAMRRYLFHLAQAEHLARQAVCPACQAYARWDILPAGAVEPGALEPGALEAAVPGEPVLAVRCRGCGHRWQLCD